MALTQLIFSNWGKASIFQQAALKFRSTVDKGHSAAVQYLYYSFLTSCMNPRMVWYERDLKGHLVLTLLP